MWLAAPLAAVLAATWVAAPAAAKSDSTATSFDYKGWDAYAGGADSSQYSSLDQVNTGNVNLPMVMPNGNVSPQTPISGALQHCGLPQVASE